MSEKWQFANRSLSYIMQYAVITPAPEFFISHYHLTMIRTHLKLGHIDSEGRYVNKDRKKEHERYLAAKRRKEELKEIKKMLQREGLVPSL